MFENDIGVEDIPVTTEEARRDVATFVRAEVRRLDLRNLMNEDAAVEVLLKGCDALFLLAYYRLKILSANRGRIRTQEDLDKILSTLPADLREFYDWTLRNLEIQDPSKCILMRRIFLWLTYAKRQLTFRALSTAVSVGFGNDSSVISSQHLIPGGLESLCGGLVVLMPRKDMESSEDLGIVALAHNSVKEYVSDFARHQSPLPLLRDSSACNSEIVQASIAYMYFNHGKPLSDSSFLDYVYRFWMDHLFGTKTPTPSLTNGLVRFFPSGECLAWWEATDRDLHWGINDIHILQSAFRYWITKVAPSGSKLGQTIEFMTTLQKKQLEACAKKHGKSHPLSLKFMANLVSTYWISGRPQEAEFLGAELVSRCKKANLSKSPDTVDALSGLAEVYGSLPRMSRLGWKEAEDLQKLIIETRTSTTALGERDADILKSMLGLVVICGREGRVKEAELYTQKVIDISEGIIGDLQQPDVSKEQIDSKGLETAGCAIALVRDDPEIIEIMNTLVSAYGNLGKMLDAERVGLQVIAKSAKVFGKKDPHTLSAMEDLANVYGGQGRSEEALKLGQKAFDTRVEVLCQDHPDTIKAMGLLIACYMSKGHIKKAQYLAVNLLDIRRRVLGNDNPSTLASIDMLVQIHLEQSQWREAEGLIRDLIAASTRIRGADHPETLGAMNRLAMVYGYQGRMQ
ncbi:uncharacterized protein H6S33_012712 [Morchella sextelata]|uniref:uncharacterized protein n=1 Tax=Morchella sextelata TaxID=1174677 RepID=UPI001D04F1BD|nr:uncharacterized protein H6S33_012712 [Morchella sextelata]KAH0609226.1 hypothetical protein H6S33_012712 [Morchella sextelata]